ncbi:MAG: ribose-phosphate diphosphokinase [Patescibacteria group bacterium]|nr:ribose-phosphate diphosphokinase [Patescibacteria group bacterium]
MKLFSGLSNPPLAQKIATNLKISLSSSKTVVFEDGEVKPVIEDNVRDEVAVIVQSTTKKPNDYWMELFFMADALRREAARKIIAVIPNFGYARQNQQHKRGEPVSAHVMVHFLESAGISEVITVDLHDETMTGMFDIPITNLSALPIFARYIKPKLPPDFVVAAPDQGGFERARLLAKSFGENTPVVVCEKQRDLDVSHKSSVSFISGEVRGKTVIVQDDVITSGGTVLNAVEALLNKNAKEVIVFVTHEDFIGDASLKIDKSKISKFYITNSVQTDDKLLNSKIEIIDISSLLASAIQKVI